MSAGLEFMSSVQTLPAPVVSLIDKAVERMLNGSVADSVAQNHAYLHGIINACVTLNQLSQKDAWAFCSAALKLCCDRIDELAVRPNVVNAVRPLPHVARRVH